jgi:hypothetical protein
MLYRHVPEGQLPGPGLQLSAHCLRRPPAAGLHRDSARRAQGHRRLRPSSASSASAPGPTGPQTDGKIERFRRALAGGWACARPDSTEPERRAALPD